MIHLRTGSPHTRLGALFGISVRKRNQIKPLCRAAASSNTSLERTREGQSAKLIHRRARRSTQPLGAVSRAILVLLVFLLPKLGHASCPFSPDVAYEEMATNNPTVRWDKPSLVEADFNDDGFTDFAMIGYEEEGLVLAVQASSQQGSRYRSELLPFGVGGSIQGAVCSLPVALSIHEQVCDPGEGLLAGCRESKRSKSLSLEDGECDSIHLYWNRDEERMEWWRR